MDHIIVAVHDRALDAFLPPWTTPATGAAIRAFQDAINDPQSPMQKHPDDYDLYQLAVYNDGTGRITPLDEPKQIAIGKQLTSK